MKVSVIIPVYNEERYLKNCLDSLTTNQATKPDEIIVVDNNSSDASMVIAGKYKNVRVLKEKKQGITPARNAGFDFSKGDILIKCDADTRMPHDFIKKVKETFSKVPDLDAISFPGLVYDMPGIFQSVYFYYIYMFIPRVFVGFYPMVGPGYAITRKAWRRVRGEVCLDDKKVHEDIDISFHIGRKGKVYHDGQTVFASSARRIKYKPWSFFGEYTVRFFRMLKDH